MVLFSSVILWSLLFALISGLVLSELKFLRCLAVVLYQVQSNLRIYIDMPVTVEVFLLYSSFLSG